MAVNELGRRERKKLATHRALRSATLRLAAERGLQKVTVEDIAEAADVSVRTFYDHFTSKEDAIVGFDPERVEQLRGSLAARPGDEPPLVALRVVLGELAAPLVEQIEDWPMRMEVVRANPALLPRMLASFATYERVIVEVVASRTGTDPDRDLYPTLTATVAMGAFRAAMAVWRSTSGARPLPELLDAAFAEVAAGLAAPDPSEVLTGPPTTSGRRGTRAPGSARATPSVPATVHHTTPTELA